MTPFMGFMPDVEQTTAGVLIEVEDVIPTINGFRAIPSFKDAGVSALTSDANSLAAVEKLDGSSRLFAGTATTLEEASLTAWTDRTRAVGGAYACDADDRWSFAQFGNYTLAANIADTMQVSTTAAFSDIAGSPQAAYIAVSEGFVMAANLSTSSDGWHCSAYLDYSDWTEAISTQCTSGRLIGGGGIVGLKAFGSGFVIFKKRKMYLASYVGAPIVWQFEEIPGDIGVLANRAAVDIGDQIAFVGNDDFYIFDGVRANPIGQGIREWFFGNLNQDFKHKTMATYDDVIGNITFHYCSESSATGIPDKAVVYNVRTKKWGAYSAIILAASSFLQDTIVYDDFGAAFGGGDYDALSTEIPFDYTIVRGATAYIQTDGLLYTLSGVSTNSSMTMNVFGDDDMFSTITRVRPRFVTVPESSYIQYSYDNDFGDDFTEKSTYALTNGKYDLMHSTRWHKVKFNFAGTIEIVGATISYTPDGEQ